MPQQLDDRFDLGGVVDQVGSTLGDLGRGLRDGGVGALLDVEGTLDRQRAKRDLAGRFEIIEPGHGGKRMPNQVTADEYEAIASQYSEIRLGRTDIAIDSSSSDDPGAYEASVMDNIGDIMQTRSGRELIRQLADNTNGVDKSGDPIHMQTTIAPHIDDGVLVTDNATTGGDFADGVGTPFASGRPGVGSNASIQINPGQDVGDLRPDVALFHELAHAYYLTNGIVDGGAIQPDDAIERERRAGRLGGVVRETTTPDQNVVSDARKGAGRHEHQAVGLGLYRDLPLTENAYRRERRHVAETGLGRAGDAQMPRRDTYLERDDD